MPRMQATDPRTGTTIEVDVILFGNFEELTVEVGRSDRGRFWVDLTDHVSGQRFPSGPHESFKGAMEALTDAYAEAMA